MKPISDELHVKRDANQCPYCGSEELEFYDIEFEVRCAFQWCYCSDCKKEWQNNYKLVGYSEIQEDGK